MLFEGGFSFANFLVDVIAVFVFVVWFWLLITVFGDLFRRHATALSRLTLGAVRSTTRRR